MADRLVKDLATGRVASVHEGDVTHHGRSE